MRSFTKFSLAAGVLSANAINLVERTDGSPPRVVQHEIKRNSIANFLEHDRARMQKRAGTVSAKLDNQETLYFMDVSIGTPAQDMKLHIDTGSSDLWVNVADSTLCSNSDDPCSVSGVYAPNSSSTYEYINGEFNISYVDGSGASGDYVSDTVKFGGVTLKAQEFGIGYTSDSEQGLIGIGYPVNEAIVAFNGGQTYSNVPKSLVTGGYINSNAYSLWLNDLDASTGSILFGGVNTAKYTGSLQTLPIIKEEGRIYAEFIIALTGVGANGQDGSIAKDIKVPALLDSGSSLMYLPDNIAEAIFKATDAQYDSDQGAAFVDCSVANKTGSIDFTFSSPTIRVDLSELVLVAGYSGGQAVCILGIAPTGGSTPVLGDTFLRSAYVVYDLENNEISLAQTKFDGTNDDVKEITKSSGVPDATSVTNAVTSVAVSTGGSRLGTGSLSSEGAAVPTAAVSYNLALVGAAGAAIAMLA